MVPTSVIAGKSPGQDGHTAVCMGIWPILALLTGLLCILLILLYLVQLPPRELQRTVGVANQEKWPEVTFHLRTPHSPCGYHPAHLRLGPQGTGEPSTGIPGGIARLEDTGFNSGSLLQIQSLSERAC